MDEIGCVDCVTLFRISGLFESLKYDSLVQDAEHLLIRELMLLRGRDC